MSALSPEQLDEARGKEAFSRVFNNPGPLKPQMLQAAELAARLAREGWTPPDPDLIEARRVVAESHRGTDRFAVGVLAGERDDSYGVTIALAAIKRGRELAAKP